MDETPFVVEMVYVWLDLTAQIFPNASNFSKQRPKKKKQKGPNLLLLALSPIT